MAKSERCRVYTDGQQRRLKDGLGQAADHARNQDWAGAREALEALIPEFSNNVALLTMLASVYNMGGDHIRCCELTRDILREYPEKSELYAVLLNSAHALDRPVTMFFATTEFLRRWPEDPKAETLRKVQKQVEQVAMAIMEADGFQPDQLDRAVLAEEVSDWYLRDQYQQALDAAERLLALGGGGPRSLNNAAVALWAGGQLPRALEVAQEVLEGLPDHLGATVNAIQCLVMLDQGESAAHLAERIRHREPSDGDLEIMMTGLAYVGDSAGIKKIYDGAVAAGHKPTPLEYHLAGTAESRLATDGTAQRLWHRALNRDPEMTVTDDNLQDLRVPPQDRNGPCFVGFRDWVPPVLQDGLQRSMADNPDDVQAVLEEVSKDLLTAAPWLKKSVPVLLKEGDRRTRAFALFVAFASRDRDARQAGVSFLSGEVGPADLRSGFAGRLVEAGLLPPDFRGLEDPH